MNKTALALALAITVMFSLIVGAQLSPLTKANIMIGGSPANINVLSPINGTYNTNSLSLSVNFTTYATGLYDGGPRYENTRMFTYTLDEKETRNITITRQDVGRAPGADVFFEGEESLHDLTEGLHNLTVRAVFIYSHFPPSWMSDITYESKLSVLFRVDTVPQNITIMKPENTTYAPSEVPLSCFIDEPASWVGYSLDGQENVTIAGNTTLTNLTCAEHNITVYAADEAGNTGASEMIFFTIEEPPEIFPTTMVIAPVALLSVVGSGLLIYFKKRKR
ncbi:MAG: hypothetical protein NWE80_02880 [Candidatus Bathyarchaeota archaeon]|nr:hypothetical protein [Candidatus Bathyarchaeota archaeon]